MQNNFDTTGGTGGKRKVQLWVSVTAFLQLSDSVTIGGGGSKLGVFYLLGCKPVGVGAVGHIHWGNTDQSNYCYLISIFFNNIWNIIAMSEEMDEIVNCFLSEFSLAISICMHGCFVLFMCFPVMDQRLDQSSAGLWPNYCWR